MKKINILVTGAGSGVGQSIIKALNISSLKLNIISCDIDYLNSGLYRTKKSLLIPKFDKSIDNRLPKKKWQVIKKKTRYYNF